MHVSAVSCLLTKGVLAGADYLPSTVEIELRIPPRTLAEADRLEAHRGPQAFVRIARELLI